MWLAKSRFLGFAFGMTNLEPRAEYRVPSTEYRVPAFSSRIMFLGAFCGAGHCYYVLQEFL